MKKITCEIYDNGIDFCSNNYDKIISVPLNELINKKKYNGFKHLVIKNMESPIDFRIEFKNHCSSIKKFKKNRLKLFIWIYTHGSK